MASGLVSVIVPVYNREKLVKEAVSSILAQTYKNLEIILINDGSTDQSLEVLKQFETENPDQIKVIDQKNQGQIAARNNGIRASSGEYIAFLDSDDLWLPEKLELQIPLFGPEVGLVYSSVELIDDHGKSKGFDHINPGLQGNIFPELLVKNRMTGGTVVVRKDVLDEVGLFDPQFKAAENWDLWLRICKKYEARAINKPLVKYRVHDDNMSKNSILMLDSKRQIMEKHCDKGSKDKRIARFSKLAEADYYYRLGVSYFSNEEFSKAIACFVKVNIKSLSYKDSIVRLFRSFLGRHGNRLLRSLKKSDKYI